MTDLCVICTQRVHQSNIKVRCSLCLSWAHMKCLNKKIDDIFFCGMCLNDSLPFINLSSNDFYEQIGISFHNIKTNIADSCRHKLNLNPYQDLDDKFCDSNDIDADKNFYNIDLNNFNDYFDYVQMNKTLPPCSSGVQSMLHINAGSLVAHIDSLNIHLDTLKHKFSIIGVTETWTNNTNESSINIPGYEMWIKSRLDSKGYPALGGGIALYFDSNLNLDIKARPDISCDNSNEMECLFAQVSHRAVTGTLGPWVRTHPQIWTHHKTHSYIRI